MFTKLKAAGIRFSYCKFSTLPEIPCVTDVLYAMELGEKQECYSFCVGNHATYTENIGLVLAATAVNVLCQERYDEAIARKIIAEAILDLCPDEAKCLFNSAFVNAQEIASGVPAPSKTAKYKDIVLACGCSSCKQKLEEGQNFDYETAYI